MILCAGALLLAMLTDDSLEFLRWEECEVGQGRLLADLVPIDRIAQLVARRGVGRS